MRNPNQIRNPNDEGDAWAGWVRETASVGEDPTAKGALCEGGSQVFLVGDVAVGEGAGGDGGAFDDEPAGPVDVVEGVFDFAEIDAALAEEGGVFFAVDFADAVAAELADFLVDVVALAFGIGDIVVDADGRGGDGVEDADVVFGAEPVFEAEDGAGLFGGRGDFLEAGDDLGLEVRFVLDVATGEEGHQDDLLVHLVHDLDALLDPFLGTIVRGVGDGVEDAHGQGGDFDVVLLGGSDDFLAGVGFAEVVFGADVVEAELDAIEADLLGQVEGGDLLAAA